MTMRPFAHLALPAFALLSVASVARAERHDGAATTVRRPTRPAGTVVMPERADRPVSGFQIVEPPTVVAGGFSNKIFINNCKPNGCTITGNGEDSSSNRSSIITGTRRLTAFAFSDANWEQVAACVREIFSPYAVEVLTTDPGATPHMEVMVAGRPTEIGMANNVGGVAPFTCGYIPNSISYAFANIYGGDVDELCAVIGQEVAHTWGLEHEMLASDPMTYLDFNGRRRFQNQAANIGEFSPRRSDCGNATTQNSHAEITSVFGGSTPTPPTVTITAPVEGASVNPGFPVRADVIDDTAVTKVALYIDNQLVDEITGTPWVFNAPDDLGDGVHLVEVRGYDLVGTMGKSSVEVVIGAPCERPSDCAEQGETFTCVGGRCVQGPGAPGGLGEPCTMDPECSSGQCASDGVDMVCVEVCDLGGAECPGGFGCVATTDTQGVCWPGVDDGSGEESGGICATSTGAGALPVVLGLGLAVLWPRRRRQR